MKTDSRIDKIAKKVFSNDNIETPSLDFTSNIMVKISVEKQTSTEIAPLISRNTWYIISLIIISLISYAMLMMPQSSSISLSEYIPSFDYFNTLSFKSIGISSITYYSIISVGVLFILQLIIIDHRNNQIHI
ncbi:MAG: hypothetical protein B6I18_03625 [Bacteroidetes bacterium 4572_112]|nr:MAG: hypothetical protein B6I18_03625 [Bacteroidetes bacterium 4572_112]